MPTVENGGISADGLNWKVKLRDDVKWHDGQPFTAEDVKFTLELMVDPNFRSWRRAGHELVRDLTVVSPTEITWRMERAIRALSVDPGCRPSSFPSMCSVRGRGQEHRAVQQCADRHRSVQMGATAWPAITSNWPPITDYFGDGPYLERVIYKYIPDLTVLYTQFKTGDIDVIGLQWITPDHYEEAKALADGKVVSVVAGRTVE